MGQHGCQHLVKIRMSVGPMLVQQRQFRCLAWHWPINIGPWLAFQAIGCHSLPTLAQDGKCCGIWGVNVVNLQHRRYHCGLSSVFLLCSAEKLNCIQNSDSPLPPSIDIITGLKGYTVEHQSLNFQSLLYDATQLPDENSEC